MTSAVTVEAIDGGICRIAMARPHALNAIDDAMRGDLEAALTAAASDATVRAVIVTGVGAHFSAGGDIPFLQGMSLAQVGDYHRRALKVVRAIALCPTPTVASVRGACAGGAVGFALGCDYLLASRTARFSAQFLRIGLVPDMGIGHFLSQRLGAHRALRLLLDNRVIGAEEAAALGLCDALHADDALDAETLALAGRLAALPPLAVRQTKILMRRAGGDLAGFLDAELDAAAACLGGDEFLEGASAFLEKRTPRF